MSKIEKLGLEPDVIQLRQAGLNFTEIADELNASGKLPRGEFISSASISRYLERTPGVMKEIENRKKIKMMNKAGLEMNIVGEMVNLYTISKSMLEKSFQDGTMPSPAAFKAISSEMRSTLELLKGTQKELVESQSVMDFLEIIIQVVSEVAPDAMPVIVNELEKHGNTLLYAQMIKNQEDEHLDSLEVSEEE